MRARESPRAPAARSPGALRVARNTNVTLMSIEDLVTSSDEFFQSRRMHGRSKSSLCGQIFLVKPDACVAKESLMKTLRLDSSALAWMASCEMAKRQAIFA